MAFIASTFAALTRNPGFLSGALAWINEDFTKGVHIPFPPSCAAVEARPAADSYQNRLYLVGGHSRNIVIDENFRAHAQGILAPPAPTVSSGAGATAQIGYISLYDELTGERSSLSPGTSFTGNLTRVWSSLPISAPGEYINISGLVTIAAGTVTGLNGTTNFCELRPGDRIAKASDQSRWAQVRRIFSPVLMTIDDTTMAGVSIAIAVKPVSRISHVELWVSVGGALPRFIVRVYIGTTSITESTATLALGEAFIDSFEPMPRGSWNVIYNSRQVVGGVVGQLDRVFVSPIDFPERYGGLSFTTRHGEPVVGAVRTRDYVLILCPHSSYRLQGFTEDDFAMTSLESEIGGIGHVGNAICGGRVFIPSREQIQLFDGSFNPIMPSRASEWSDEFRASTEAFQLGVGMVDPESQTYRFLPYPLRIDTAGQAGEVVPIDGLGSCALIGLADPDKITYPCVYVVSGTQTTPGLFVFSPDQSPVLQRFEYLTTGEESLFTGDGAVLNDGDGGLWVAGSDDTNVYLKRFTGGAGMPVVARVAHSGINVHVCSVVRHREEIYISITGSGNTVFRYNGGPDLLVEDTSGLFNGILVSLGLHLYHFSNGEDPGTTSDYVVCRRRNASGVWSSFTLPYAGVFPFIRDAIVYENAIYLVGGGVVGVTDGPAIHKISPVGTVTLAHDLGAGQLSVPMALAVFNGYLYYTTKAGSMGRFDGTTWEDNHANLSTYFEFVFVQDEEEIAATLFFGELNGSLHLITLLDTRLPCPFEIFSSSGTNTDAGWWIRHHMLHHNPWRYGDLERWVRQGGVL